MPSNDDPNNPDPVLVLQQQVDQLQRENSFLREERNTLENLVVTNLPANSSARVNEKGELEVKPNGKGEAGDPPIPSVEALVNRVVQKVDETLIKPRDKEAARLQAVADLNRLASNPKTKDIVLYMDEMRAVARQHPDLPIPDVYVLAKNNTGPKAFPPANSTDPKDLRTNQIKPAAGAERFSGAGKVKTREQADDRREASFRTSFDDAWDQTMAGKAE